MKSETLKIYVSIRDEMVALLSNLFGDEYRETLEELRSDIDAMLDKQIRKRTIVNSRIIRVRS